MGEHEFAFKVGHHPLAVSHTVLHDKGIQLEFAANTPCCLLTVRISSVWLVAAVLSVQDCGASFACQRLQVVVLLVPLLLPALMVVLPRVCLQFITHQKLLQCLENSEGRTHAAYASLKPSAQQAKVLHGCSP